MTVEEYLKSIRLESDKPSQFNKTQFEEFLSILLNDKDYINKVAKGYKNEEGFIEKDINPSKEFRKFIRKILTKLNMDANDSKIIMDYNFTIDDCRGLYEFFTTAILEYMKLSNKKFDFITNKDFKGSIYLNKVNKHRKEYRPINPRDGKPLGTYVADIGDHYVLKSKTSCPKWLNKKMPKTNNIDNSF